MCVWLVCECVFMYVCVKVVCVCVWCVSLCGVCVCMYLEKLPGMVYMTRLNNLNTQSTISLPIPG